MNQTFTILLCIGINVIFSGKRVTFTAHTSLSDDQKLPKVSHSAGCYSFIKRSVVHNKNTRGCNNFLFPCCRLSTGQRAFYFRVQGNGMG